MWQNHKRPQFRNRSRKPARSQLFKKHTSILRDGEMWPWPPGGGKVGGESVRSSRFLLSLTCFRVKTTTREGCDCQQHIRQAAPPLSSVPDPALTSQPPSEGFVVTFSTVENQDVDPSRKGILQSPKSSEGSASETPLHGCSHRHTVARPVPPVPLATPLLGKVPHADSCPRAPHRAPGGKAEGPKGTQARSGQCWPRRVPLMLICGEQGAEPPARR